MSGSLETKLINQLMQFKVVARQELDRILEEMKISRTGITRPETVKKLGSILNVDTIIIGELDDWGNIIKVNSQMVDVESGHKFGGVEGDIEVV